MWWPVFVRILHTTNRAPEEATFDDFFEEKTRKRFHFTPCG